MTAKNRKRPRSTNKIPLAERASILAYARQHGAKKAAEEFKVSERSITRMRAALRMGKEPELASLVRSMQREAIEKNQDLLTQTFEVVLQAIKDKAPTAEFPDLVKAAEKLGEIHITNKELNRDTAPAQQGAEDSEDPEGADVPGPEARGKEPPGSSAQPGPPRVH